MATNALSHDFTIYTDSNDIPVDHSSYTSIPATVNPMSSPYSQNGFSPDENHYADYRPPISLPLSHSQQGSVPILQQSSLLNAPNYAATESTHAFTNPPTTIHYSTELERSQDTEHYLDLMGTIRNVMRLSCNTDGYFGNTTEQALVCRFLMNPRATNAILFQEVVRQDYASEGSIRRIVKFLHQILATLKVLSPYIERARGENSQPGFPNETVLLDALLLLNIVVPRLSSLVDFTTVGNPSTASPETPPGFFL